MTIIQPRRMPTAPYHKGTGQATYEVELIYGMELCDVQLI